MSLHRTLLFIYLFVCFCPDQKGNCSFLSRNSDSRNSAKEKSQLRDKLRIARKNNLGKEKKLSRKKLTKIMSIMSRITIYLFVCLFVCLFLCFCPDQKGNCRFLSRNSDFLAILQKKKSRNCAIISFFFSQFCLRLSILNYFLILQSLYSAIVFFSHHEIKNYLKKLQNSRQTFFFLKCILFWFYS